PSRPIESAARVINSIGPSPLKPKSLDARFFLPAGLLRKTSRRRSNSSNPMGLMFPAAWKPHREKRTMGRSRRSFAPQNSDAHLINPQLQLGMVRAKTENTKSAFGKPVCIVAAEVTRLKYSWESSIFMQRNEPRYLGCYNFKTVLTDSDHIIFLPKLGQVVNRISARKHQYRQ